MSRLRRSVARLCLSVAIIVLAFLTPAGGAAEAERPRVLAVDFAGAVHPHPTLSEAVKVAAREG